MRRFFVAGQEKDDGAVEDGEGMARALVIRRERKLESNAIFDVSFKVALLDPFLHLVSLIKENISTTDGRHMGCSADIEGKNINLPNIIVGVVDRDWWKAD